MILVLAVFSLNLSGCSAGYAAPVAESPDAMYALGVAQARATADAMRVQQTQVMIRATLDFHALQMTAEQAGFERGLTATAVEGQAQQTQQLATQQVMLRETAWVLTQTPMAATQQAMDLVIEQQAREAAVTAFVQPMVQVGKVLLLALVMMLMFIGVIRLWPHLIRLLQVLERRAGTIVSPDGQVITYIPVDDRVNVVQPGQSFYPVMQVGVDGGAGSGAAEDELQNLQNSRAQTIALARALGRGGSGKAGRALRVRQAQRPYRILQPGSPIPLRRDALDAEWRGNEEE